MASGKKPAPLHQRAIPAAPASPTTSRATGAARLLPSLKPGPPAAHRRTPRSIESCHDRRMMAGGPQPHSWSIDEREYTRQESRRGRRYAYEDLEPARTALVVVDMVPFFATAGRYFRGIVPNINALASALRDAGGTVAWVLPEVGPPSDWATGFYGIAVARTYAASGGVDPLRKRLLPELDARADDVWVEKSAPSAFFPGRSALPAALDDRDVDTVLITGTVTSVCCESTARDAATLGYRVVFVADGAADVRDSVHNAALRTIYRAFGDVRPTAEVLELIRAFGRP
jgi:nicotinamidase-related amidase